MDTIAVPKRESPLLIFVVIISAMAMEPITAVLHRAIMHHGGWSWHKSHHRRIGSQFERNDLYPLCFSVIAIGLFILGTSSSTFRGIGIGVTIYGATYLFVHEVVIHSRFGKIASSNRLFRYWRFAHNVHHQFNAAPFGFIVPIVPKSLGDNSRQNPRNLIDRYGTSQNNRDSSIEVDAE